MILAGEIPVYCAHDEISDITVLVPKPTKSEFTSAKVS